MNSATNQRGPEIAIMGHPNEGKSSVLSTLAEDDSVRVSPVPGETTECRTFPVVIDGKEVLRFTDTPGFQNPSRVLAEMRKLAEAGGDCVAEFRRRFRDEKDLADDVELLEPVERGSGIIYVVDGSRPVRNVDKAEMEILRLTGRPRMAIINCKEDNRSLLDQWKNEFRKNFNANRVFNAHRATYAERILLLEALKSIDQDWQPTLNKVVESFKSDWAARNSTAVDILLTMFTQCLQYSISETLQDESKSKEIEQELAAKYRSALERKEQKAHEQIRALFKHNIFRYSLPPHSLLNDELFSEKTWNLLGLSKKQITIAGAIGGAVVGAKLDLLTAGLSFGIFTGIGSAAGAFGALFGGKKLSAGKNLLGFDIGGEQLKIGPSTNLNLLLILINRALIFYQHTINWAHGRRDYQTNLPEPVYDTGSAGYTSNWSATQIRVCKAFLAAATDEGKSLDDAAKKLGELLSESLEEISSK